MDAALQTPFCSTMMSLPTLPKRGANHRRARFVIFLKILLDSIQKSGDYHLHKQAKHTVAFCTQLNRMGDARFTPLVNTLEVCLRDLVGELHWRHAELQTRKYLAKKSLCTMLESKYPTKSIPMIPSL